MFDSLTNQSPRLIALFGKQPIPSGLDYMMIATPTYYDLQTNYFDTHTADSAVADVQAINSSAVMEIKPTVLERNVRITCWRPLPQFFLGRGGHCLRKGVKEQLAYDGQHLIDLVRVGGEADCLKRQKGSILF